MCCQLTKKHQKKFSEKNLQSQDLNLGQLGPEANLCLNFAVLNLYAKLKIWQQMFGMPRFEPRLKTQILSLFFIAFKNVTVMYSPVLFSSLTRIPGS